MWQMLVAQFLGGKGKEEKVTIIEFHARSGGKTTALYVDEDGYLFEDDIDQFRLISAQQTQITKPGMIVVPRKDGGNGKRRS